MVQTASDRMLRGRSPWGLGRGVFVFVRRSLVARKVSLIFGLGFKDALNPSRIYEDYIGGLR
jgi:hypothetical protein